MRGKRAAGRTFAYLDAKDRWSLYRQRLGGGSDEIPRGPQPAFILSFCGTAQVMPSYVAWDRKSLIRQWRYVASRGDCESETGKMVCNFRSMAWERGNGCTVRQDACGGFSNRRERRANACRDAVPGA